MAAYPRRYTIYYADLNSTAGAGTDPARPVVVVSENNMNRFLDTIVICPLATHLHPRWRSRIQVVCGGMAAEVAVDQIRTIRKSRLGRSIDKLSPAVAGTLRRLITEMYGQ